jgi:zinc protease
MTLGSSLIIAIVSFAAPVAQDSGVVEFRAAGTQVLFRPVTGNEVIAAHLYLKGGSATLAPAQAGIERLIGVLSTRGTENYSREQFAARTAATGAEIGTRQTHDYSVMTLRTVRDQWDHSWDLFVEAALRPTFPDSELSLVREQLLNGLRRRDDSPDGQVRHVADSMFFRDHPYAVDPAGTRAALRALTRDDLRRWHRDRMTQENLLLVVLGNVPRADLEAKVRNAFGRLPDRGGGARSPGPVPVRVPDVKVVPRQLPTNYVLGLFSAPGLPDTDYAAMRVATDILSNRLFEEIRSKRGLSRSTSAGINSARVNTGFLYLTAVELDTAFKIMRHEVERLQTEPISDKRLGETVNVFLTRYFLEQETNADQASSLAAHELLGGGWQRAATFLERVRTVTPADVQRVARRYIKNLRFAVVGDSSKIDRTLFTSM